MILLSQCILSNPTLWYESGASENQDDAIAQVDAIVNHLTCDCIVPEYTVYPHSMVVLANIRMMLLHKLTPTFHKKYWF